MLWCLFLTQKLKTSGPGMIQLFLCYLAFGCVVSYHLLQQSLWLQIVHYLSKFDTLTQGHFWLPFSMAATKISVCLVHWIHSHGELKGQEVLDYYFPVACGSVFFFCCLPVFWVISPDTKLLVSFSQWSSVILLSVLYLPGCIIVVSSPPGIKKMGHSWLSGECCSPFLLNVLCYYSVFNLVIFQGSDPFFLY